MSRDWFVSAFGSAVADVRQKLVEEAWFGRRVTPLADHHRQPERDGREAEHDPLGRTRDFDIDR